MTSFFFSDEFKSQLACEGQEMVIYCPKKKTRIALYSAMFGRTAEGPDECPSPTVSGGGDHGMYHIRPCKFDSVFHVLHVPILAIHLATHD
jgi:hypothetical protein